MQDGLGQTDDQGRFWSAFDLLVRALAHIAAIVFVAAILVVLTEIVSRYFFHHPILGSVETTEYCLVWMTFLAAPWVQSRGGNVKVDFLLNSLGPKSRAMLCFVVCLCAAAICLLLTYAGFTTVRAHYEMGYYLSTPLHPPSAPLICIIPISTLLLTIQFVRETLSHFRTLAGT